MHIADIPSTCKPTLTYIRRTGRSIQEKMTIQVIEDLVAIRVGKIPSSIALISASKIRKRGNGKQTAHTQSQMGTIKARQG